MSATTMSPALPAAGGFTPGLLPPMLPSPQAPERALAGTRTRRKHAALAVLSALAALLLFTALAFHGYVAWVIAHPYVPALYSNPKIAQGLDYSDVSFPSKSGRTTVHGWYIPAVGAETHSDRTVVFSHGYGANREETWVPMYELAALLNRLHYNVFMFDYGYASSGQRSPATGGKEESQQLLAAVNYARSQGADEVVVWGFSMGAGTALQAALQTDSTDSIDAMILDSTFLPSSDSLYNNVRQYMDLPKYPSIPIIEWMLPFFTGVNFNQLPVEQVLQTTYDMPLFIMHGTADAKAPVATAEQVSASQYNSLSREWIVEGGMHEMLFRTHPKEYIQRAALFLSQVDAARKSTSAA
ncbi:alpha/beta hydrolase [Paenibacillus lignilyticus]|uniref:Alpha/beta fold hydrolase n=1 Tax=Paenibacillus lignilyticus TaxID=1172615 RepID=A0ABS5CMB5_9BACL|nr:alpha/beta fold hydrolase [Paenibacillus lignilyticus]MBP3966995.1 alpha/beta fold hydrolase [Paenibacillus lignilyticus]